MSVMALSNQDARRFLLTKQGLWPPRSLHGRAGILSVFERLAAVQFDPLDVVGRNPDLVLQSRVQDYHVGDITELAYDDRELYDYWDKRMCLVPVRDWPMLAPERARWRQRHAERLSRLSEQVDTVLAVIRKQGPMSSLDFDPRHNLDWKMDWRWGPMRVVKAVLEMLADTGDLMVSHRQGTRRYYDLAERVLPEFIYSEPPLEDTDVYSRWRLARRCKGVGLLGPGLGGEAWAGLGKAQQRAQATDELVADGKLVALKIEGDQRTYYALSQDLPLLERVRASDIVPQVAFLAPLDNLLWSRNLVERVFGFRYVWEVYKPAHQRKYGYYVLPVLFGDRLVARFDSRMDHTAGGLSLLSWHWEPGEVLTDALDTALRQAMDHFLAYLGADRVIADPGVDPTIASCICS